MAASVDFNEPGEKIPALCSRRDLILRFGGQPGSGRLSELRSISWGSPDSKARITGTFGPYARSSDSKEVYLDRSVSTPYNLWFGTSSLSLPLPQPRPNRSKRIPGRAVPCDLSANHSGRLPADGRLPASARSLAAAIVRDISPGHVCAGLGRIRMLGGRGHRCY